ncbi:MAG: hypothetical protein ACOYOV_15415, partial [Bacteroidales bacterium]
VKIEICNSIGSVVSVVETCGKSTVANQVVIDGSQFAEGVYYCKLYTSEGVFLTKAIKNK